MRIFIALCLAAFWIGLSSLVMGCSVTMTIVPVDTQEITQKTLGNKLWDWAFKDEVKKS